jgi:hypothetical protein
MERVTMADVVYIPVDAESGEPYIWGSSEERRISVFGDLWRCRRSPESEGKAIRAVALEDLPELLESRWSQATHVSYHPRADAYQLPLENVKEMASAYVASVYG